MKSVFDSNHREVSVGDEIRLDAKLGQGKPTRFVPLSCSSSLRAAWC